jgi:DNA-binding transcriptional LysR family regulator
MDSLDWSLIRSFLAVADAGSLSAAARATGISQPSLGRHIAALDSALGTRLFQRDAKGQRLTPSGLALLPAARDMAVAAARLSLAATAQNTAMTGTVRITASRVVSAHILPPILARLRQEEPGIQLEIVPSDSVENLLFHAADLAVRMLRPTQGDLITRRVATMPLGLYAARSLIERQGQPMTPEALLQMDFVGYDQSDQIIRLMADIGRPVNRSFFPLRCDDQLVHLALVRSGCGVSGMPVAIGGSDPLLQRIDAGVELPDLPVWLVAAPGLRETPRIARVWDALAEGLALSLGPP